MLLLLLACADAPPSDSPALDSEATDPGLWDTPGAPFTASWLAAEALAACRDAWVEDAHVQRVEVYNDLHSVYLFAESAPAQVCVWATRSEGEAGVSTDSSANYRPGWTWTPADRLVGWAADSDGVAADAGVDTADGAYYLSLTPAGHRRQLGWQAELEGLDDDHPVYVIGQTSTEDLQLYDGRTGERLGP
ncbi:MAG: hypothetical protein H6740_25660 [Alphaproteobacteria bacterium]|nr:hypothetical protein [Alphaproteobacteria bacterium]